MHDMRTDAAASNGPNDNHSQSIASAAVGGHDSRLLRWTGSLNLPQWVRDAVAHIYNVTLEVGGRVIEIGKRIIAFVARTARRFPNASFAAVFFAVLAWIAAGVPLLGPVLAPIIALAGGVLTMVTVLQEMGSPVAAREELLAGITG